MLNIFQSLKLDNLTPSSIYIMFISHFNIFIKVTDYNDDKLHSGITIKEERFDNSRLSKDRILCIQGQNFSHSILHAEPPKEMIRNRICSILHIILN